MPTAGPRNVAWFLAYQIVAKTVHVATIRYARNQATLRGPAVGTGVLLALVLAFGLVIRVTHSDQLGVPFSLATVALVWTQVLLAARASLGKSPVKVSS